MNKTENWFKSWFDSPYYQLLYKDRDDVEAEFFIDNLFHALQVPKNAKILDLACGRGRHSKFMNRKGCEVTGIDLSPQSIAFAKRYENARLKFQVHDLRFPFKENYFDYVVNLFTSFGYFEKDADDIAALTCAERALKKNGTLVIDFLNVEKAINNLKLKEEINYGGICFRIRRKISNGFIIKQIVVIDKDKRLEFHERVKALGLSHFKNYFQQSGLKPVRLYGGYDLVDFDIKSSDRLIMVANK